MSMYPWDWVAPLVPEPENPMGPMPQPPVPVQPQLVPGPRGFQRALEYGMAPLADMPWVPMRGRGENFLQGLIGGVAAKQRAKGMGRAQENEARARAADEANKEARGEYRSNLAEWHRYQRAAKDQFRRDKASALKALMESSAKTRQLPKELAPFAPGFKAGDVVPEAIYRDALNEWQQRTRPDKPKSPPKPQRPPAYTAGDYRREAVGTLPDLVTTLRSDLRDPFKIGQKEALSDSLNKTISRSERVERYGQRIAKARSIAELVAIGNEYMDDADLMRVPGIEQRLNYLIDQRETELEPERED